MKCVGCNEVEIEEPEMCCSGWMCGCMGMPINPPFCKDCWKNKVDVEMKVLM